MHHANLLARGMPPAPCGTDEGPAVTLVGISTLRFDPEGLVLEQRDTWNQSDGRVRPPESWGR